MNAKLIRTPFSFLLVIFFSSCSQETEIMPTTSDAVSVEVTERAVFEETEQELIARAL